jgi:cellobiose phosphorylase
MAFARLGDGTRAAELLTTLMPIAHTATFEQAQKYRVEPYAIAADIYYLKGHIGRGGWSWYTGSAAWLYRIWLEEVLGFTLRGNILSFKSALPKSWESVMVHYRYKSTLYKITVKATPYQIQLEDDGKEHIIDMSTS